MNRRLALAAATVIAALTLTACGTSTSPAAVNPAPARTASPAYDTDSTDGETSTDRRELTETAIDITWDNSTPTDQRNMCNGITIFGTEWAANELREGAGGDDTTLDWDYAAELIEGKCGL